MTETVGWAWSAPREDKPARPGELSADRLRALYHALLVPRLIEEKALLLLRQGKLSKWFSGMGQEAIAVGVAAALEPDDWILPMHRNLGVFTTRGVDLARLFRQLFGRDGGFTRGRDRTFHFGLLESHIVGMISHLGAMLPVADGLALAAQLKGTRQVAATFTGDGATSEGDFHEAVNLAAVWKLPVLFVIENNCYGLSTPANEQYACRDLADRGVGYGIPGHVVDGNDLLAVLAAVTAAAERARRGDGPTLLEFKTFRMRGHEEASGTAYVPKHLFEEWAAKDPVVRFEAMLHERGVLHEGDIDRLRAALKVMIDSLVDEALIAPLPASTAEREIADVFAPPPALPAPPLVETRRHVHRDALRGRDPRRPARGDAAAPAAGPHGPGHRRVRRGLQGHRGLRRGVRQEARPQHADHRVRRGRGRARPRPGRLPARWSRCSSATSSPAASTRSSTTWPRRTTGGARAVPVVIRAPVGGGVGAGPFHSQNVESWFTSVAGLKVVAPATAADAKGLLLASVEDGNPVLYLEHKFLYRSSKEQVPAGPHRVPLGVARLARPGRDATVVTYGVGVLWALEAAARLAEKGREIEVIDLRTLLPWDREMVLGSVRKTGRALVLHEAPVTGGFGGELAAVIGSEAFESLDAPVARLGALDTPIPFSKALEEIFSPRGRLDQALEELLAY